jgi:hypothetical protein
MEKINMKTAEEVINYMKNVFDKEASLKIKKQIIVTINVAGPGGGTWQLILNKGECKFQPGNEISPIDATTNYRDVESFYKLTTGEMSGVRGYASGAIKVDGPAKILVSVGKVFLKNKAKKKKIRLRKK